MWSWLGGYITFSTRNVFTIVLEEREDGLHSGQRPGRRSTFLSAGATLARASPRRTMERNILPLLFFSSRPRIWRSGFDLLKKLGRSGGNGHHFVSYIKSYLSSRIMTVFSSSNLKSMIINFWKSITFVVFRLNLFQRSSIDRSSVAPALVIFCINDMTSR